MRVFQVPYDSGHRALRMGRGPLRLAEAGLAERVRGADPGVRLAAVEPDLAFPTEIAAAFGPHRALAGLVRGAAQAGAFPLVLARNFTSATGTVSGLQAARPDERAGVGPANGYAPVGGGLTPDQVIEGVRLAAARFGGVAAAGTASYDPAFDAGGRVAEAALAFAEAASAARLCVRTAA